MTFLVVIAVLIASSLAWALTPRRYAHVPSVDDGRSSGTSSQGRQRRFFRRTAVRSRVRESARWHHNSSKGSVYSRMRERMRIRHIDLGVIVAEVATRLRSGARMEDAWQRTLDRHDPRQFDPQKKNRHHTSVQHTVDVGHTAKLSDSAGSASVRVLDDDGVPLRLLEAAPRIHIRRRRRRTNQRRRHGARPFFSSRHPIPGLAEAVAVCRMSGMSGAPIADVLDTCAAGITEAAEESSARKIALAGPRSSARLLAFLPLLGLLLGYVVGARPLDVFRTTMIGHVCAAVGISLEIAGILWIRELTRQAEHSAL
ncbi:MAG: hypothetical protein SPI12_01360 [Actinomycetaceae bacterium]|nr:hypothetical protein [Actinomycetaceae bacterium]MDY6082495.1 hypothetical protein [Actinomycetaceae bacterium]